MKKGNWNGTHGVTRPTGQRQNEECRTGLGCEIQERGIYAASSAKALPGMKRAKARAPERELPQSAAR